jgi:hypothetical protein
MPSLVVSNAAMVRLIWSIGTDGVMINVLGAGKTGGIIGQALADTLGTAIKSSFTSSGHASHIAPDVSLVQIGVRDISTPNLVEFLDTSAAVPGTGTGDQLPAGVALAITLRTGKAGQSFRGRTFFGGYTELANQPDGTLDPAVATAAVNFIFAISGNFNASGLQLSVLSRPSELTVLTKDVTHADGTHTITSHTRKARPGGVTTIIGVEARNDIWDSQRRRTSAGSASTLRQPVARATIAQT